MDSKDAVPRSVWPAETEPGLIPTDDAMGIMTRELSPAAEAFVADAASAKLPLLDVGAAYGNATLPALAAGATVLACDLSASELAVLAASAPESHRRHLVLLPAGFPDGFTVGDGSLAAVLAAQVLHFFDGPAVERAFAAAHRWLAPGGAFHVLVMTPSLSYYSKLRGAYEKRAAAGERWPGIFDPRIVASPEWRDRLPKMVHLFERDILRRCAEEAGFTVEKLDYFCFRNFPAIHRTDGREYLTLAARKTAVGA
ncbi:MAG: class I SAM-dependent methyltransferase [Chthoniobacterales bacterium]|nr:class I SAM-dependent methyltransferase [Chthoniobacterales bacterium]